MAMAWSFLILQVSELELRWKDLTRPLQVRAFSTVSHIHYPKVWESSPYIPFSGERHSVISAVAQQNHMFAQDQIKLNAVLELSPL